MRADLIELCNVYQSDIRKKEDYLEHQFLCTEQNCIGRVGAVGVKTACFVYDSDPETE